MFDLISQYSQAFIPTLVKMKPDDISNKITNAQKKTDTIGNNIEVINSELASLANVLRKYGDSNEIQNIMQENCNLKKEIERIKQELFLAETWNGIKQYNLPRVLYDIKNEKEKLKDSTPSEPKITESAKEKNYKKDKPKEDIPKSANKKTPAINVDKDNPDTFISQIDFKIGIIKSIEKHPDADSLYVEQIDLGEMQPRTIVSGLVAHFKAEDLLNRKVVVLSNLKPLKLRGIQSQGMVMCAALGDKLEMCDPPSECIPGDRIVFPGIQGQGQYKEIKRDVFTKIASLLRTGTDFVAMYKKIPFTIADKGVVKCRSLVGAEVR